MVKLSPRLSKIFDLIPNSECLADIGCDHGYLSIAVAEAGKANRVVAMDVNKGPLESAKENVLAAGFSKIIELRLSDGLKMLSDSEAEVICICGMGGLLMKRIIDADINKAKNAKCLILEPQSEYMEFRKFLLENHFVIDDEDITTEENKIYPIIKVHFDPAYDTQMSDVELKYGPVLLEKWPSLLEKQLQKSKGEFMDIKSNLQSKITDLNKATPILERIDQLDYELKLIDEAYERFGGKFNGKDNH